MKPSKKPVFEAPLAAYRRALLSAVANALREDLGSGDITTAALKLKGKRGRAILLAKENGVLAGADAFAECFRTLDPRVTVHWKLNEGRRIRARTTVATITGDAAAILSAERSALNFVSHLSGIATSTAQMVALIPKGSARLLDTRKTTPGLRLPEKRATVLGGACNHRFGLYDAFMIKDNHTAAVGGVAQAVAMASGARKQRQLICEVANSEQIGIALEEGATWLLLDNFELPRLRAAVRQIRRLASDKNRRVILEASGGITPRNIAAVARTGVDFISSGFITHSATSIDFSLEWSGPPARASRIA